MALHKENYGLIYNDDGSLCVTLRKDDVPFPGVTSFAVEEGTTNLVNVDLTAWSEINASVATVSDVQSPIGTTVYKISDSTYNTTHYIDSNSFTVNTDAVLTFSLYAKAGTARYILLSWGQDSNYNNGHSGNPSFDLLTGQWQWNASNHGEFSAQYVGNGWWRLIFTVTNTSGTTFSDYVQIVTAQSLSTWTYAGTGAYFYVTGVQVEQKPFPTSFVDGTRPHGILKFTNPLPLDNFVINLWFTPTRYPSQTNQNWHLFDVSYNASAPQGFYIIARASEQGGIPANTLNLSVRNPSTLTYYNLGLDLSEEIGKWHMITLISNGSIVDVYIDGEKRVSATNDTQRSAIEFIVFGRYFGNISGTGMENGFLMSNVLFASYDPAIWTDEYIRTIYQAKKPFAVPPKLPIV